jgi:hypothetical protein
MKSAKPMALFVLLLVVLAAGCGARATTSGPDSETHWLTCMTDAECTSESVCQCGLCRVTCADDTTCAASGAACVAGPTCATSRPASVCAPRCQTDGDCAAGLACSGNVCAPVSAPVSPTAGATWAKPLSFQSAQLAADGQDRLYVSGVGTAASPPVSTASYYPFLTSFESNGSVRWSTQVDAGQIAVNASGDIMLDGNNDGGYPFVTVVCPNGQQCAQRRNSAGELAWTKSGGFLDVMAADGDAFWLLEWPADAVNNRVLTKVDRFGNELVKQSLSFGTDKTNLQLAPRGTVIWREYQAPPADGCVEFERTVAGDEHRIVFPEVTGAVAEVIAAADGAVVIAGLVLTDGTMALSCREMLGGLRWTLPTNINQPLAPVPRSLSFHRNGNLLVANFAVGGSTFGGSRVDGDPADTIGFVAEVDMSNGAVVWLHRLWAGPGGPATQRTTPTVTTQLVSLSDGRIAALVGCTSTSRLFLDDALIIDGLTPSAEEHALVVFKP